MLALMCHLSSCFINRCIAFHILTRVTRHLLDSSVLSRLMLRLFLRKREGEIWHHVSSGTLFAILPERQVDVSVISGAAGTVEYDYL